jgi:acetoin:2,6-dichlorophenolindophenol oxidoreductase subunit alpha
MTYRAPGEAAKLREEKDSLKIFRKQVTSAGLLEHKEIDAVEDEVATLIDKAVAAAEAAAPPSETDLATDVYVTY